MKRARRSGDQTPDRPGENGSAAGYSAAEPPEQEARTEDSGSGLEFMSDEDDPELRRAIRTKYRELITSVQQNREDMLNPANNKLTEVLDMTNRLFKDVRQPREAALDAQLLVVATDLGKEKATQMFSDGASFDAFAFAEHLLSFMGLNRLEDGSGREGDGAPDGYLPEDAWYRLASRAQSCFRTAPTFNYMLGSFHTEPPPPKQRVERQRKAPGKEAKRVMPTELKKMEESHQEATEKEVERILGYLRGYHTQDPSTPISYYEFIIDPNSFSRTVENIFHTSFLIRDGLARMYLDNSKLPCIVPVDDGAGESSSPKQCVITISPKRWRELVELLDITEPLIRPLNPHSD